MSILASLSRWTGRPARPDAGGVGSGARPRRGYQGIWSPGIRLLRNMRIARKTALIAALLVLPAGLLLHDAWQHWAPRLEQAVDAQAGLQAHDAVAALHRTLDLLMLQAAGATGGVALPAPDALKQTLAAQVAALEPALEDVGARSAVLHAALEQARQRFEANVAPWLAPAGPGTLAAARAAMADLDALHESLGIEWAMAVEHDLAEKALRDGLVDPLFAVEDTLVGLALTADGRGAELARMRLLAALDVELSGLQPSLQALRAHLLVDAATLDAALARFQRADEGTAAAVEALQAAQTLQQLGVDQLRTRLQAADVRLQQQVLLRAALLCAAVLAAAYMLICMYKVMAGGLRTLGLQLEELGRGNLSIRPRGLGRDEIGQALTLLGQSVERMATLFEAVTQGVAAVSHAAREVALGNAGLSQRTGDIQGAVGGLADRTLGFSDAMDACARQVEEASEQVRAMRDDARRSRRAMDGLRERMRTLQGKTREIQQVVTMMETVAFQTKLLSLNASVEAARAGGFGKGFAVVAQEVRALAERSEESARRIQTIVGSSVSEIEEGHRMSERASEAVQRTDDTIQSVDVVMADIVRMTREGMRQSQEVLGITREAQGSVSGNAQLVEQLSEASNALRGQGDALKRSVHHFVLG